MPHSFLRFSVFLGLAVNAAAVFAHHSFAMYDSTRLLTLDGTITEFQWTNPHARVWVQGRVNASDEPEIWIIELPTSPGGLMRIGWTKRSLNAGDHVLLQFNPLRDGKRGGSFKKVTIVNTGQVLVANPPASASGPAPASK